MNNGSHAGVTVSIRKSGRKNATRGGAASRNRNTTTTRNTSTSRNTAAKRNTTAKRNTADRKRRDGAVTRNGARRRITRKRSSSKRPMTRGRRIATALTMLVAACCAVALAWVTTQFVSGRIALADARNRQSQLSSRYGFDPGDIISDGQFFNGYAMSEAEVQSFLDDHGEACTGSACLKSRTFDTTTIKADAYCNGYQGRKRETAAAIIDKSAKSCNVSQKVLLTVMQKEQQLVTAAKPTDFQFKAAMGLSCPDDADCDPEYAGFFRQVYGAANRYQYYAHHEEQYGYHAGKLNYVKFHPNASCGGANVLIDNKATALLYIYTPYQPNDAALAAGVGEGDSCSSYGNRNFSIIYRGWFGSAR